MAASNEADSPGELRWEDVPALLEDVRLMADALLKRESNANSVQITALVNSALRRQRREGQDWEQVRWEDRLHFFRSVFRAMERALVDRARRRAARPDRPATDVLPETMQLEDFAEAVRSAPEQAVACAVALEKLEKLEPDTAEALRLYYYGGFTQDETACILDRPLIAVRRLLAKGRTLVMDSVLAELRGRAST